jgi:N-carbamoylputrescine amidase
VVQLEANPANEDYLGRAVEGVREAAEGGAQVIMLPELFRWPYFCQAMTPDHFAYAEPLDGPSVSSLRPVARELGVVIVSSFFEERAPGLYHNTAAVIDADGEVLGYYRKSHIPDDPLYFEKFYFAPGDTGFKVFSTRYARVGVLVCWDQWYPEAARLTAMAGAELLVYPTAIGAIDAEGPEQHRLQREAWQTAQRAHAISNGLYVAAANRAGREQELGFWGHSFVAGPQGELLAEAGDAGRQILRASCSRSRLRDVRQWWPFFRDRRIDLYDGLVRRFGTP